MKLKISTHTEKHSPMYHVNIETSGKSVRGGKLFLETKEPFTNWFDEQGYLVPKPLQKFLERSIPDVATTKAALKKERS